MIDKSINTFEKGLYQDTSNVNQPQGTYTFALNALKEFAETNPGVLQNEYGFKVSAQFPIGTILLGQVELEDDSSCIFTLSTATNEQKISIYKLDGSVVDIFSDTNLNFDAEHQIQATYKINSLGQRIVYFTDNFNPIRTINLEIALLDPTFYNTVDDLNLFPTTTPFRIDNITLFNTGGSLQTGGYRFFARLVKTGQSNSLFDYPTKVIYVTFGTTESNFDTNTGTISGPETHGISNCSVQLSLVDLDNDYDSIQLGYTLIQDGISTTKLITNPYTYNGSSITLTITGSESTSAIEESEVTVDNIIYSTAKTITQKDNRLLLGNVSIEQEAQNLQQYVNDIVVTWTTETESIGSFPFIVPNLTAFNSIHQYHSTIAKQYKKSFMRDEVYSLGISFLLASGNETKVYHIPGRTFTAADIVPINTADDVAAKNADPTGSAPTMLTWQVYNTAVATSSTSGTMAYWQSTEDYPSDLSLGFPGGKIRHHKMPDFKINPTFSYSIAGDFGSIFRRNLGIQVDNINLPPDVAADVVGYRIWVQDRSSFNDRSIISKGLIYNAVTAKFNGVKEAIHPFPSNNVKGNPIYNRSYYMNATNDTRTDVNTSYLFFDSPDSQSYQPPLGTLLTSETFLDGKLFYADIGVGLPANKGSNPSFLMDDPLLRYMTDTVAAGYLYAYSNNITTERVRRLRAAKYIGANTIDNALSGFTAEPITPGPGGTIDRVNNTKGSFTTLVQPLHYSDRLPRTVDNTFLHGDYAIQEPSDITIEYDPPTSNAQTMQIRYGAIKNELPAQYGGVLNKTYRTDGRLVLGTSTSVWFIGDTFIDAYQLKHNLFVKDVPFNNSFDWDYSTSDTINYAGTKEDGLLKLTGTTKIPFIASSSINTYIAESYVNHRYRSNSTEPAPENLQASKQFWPKDVYGQAASIWLQKHSAFPNYLIIKPEYSQIYSSKINVGFTTSDLLNLNTDKKGRFSTRVAYSQSDAQEALIDPYRTFLANNYRDLPRNKGQLWNLFINSNTLFGACENTLWSIFTSEQALATSKDTIVIGTGEFLGNPPREMITIDSGYAGTRSQWSFAQSPYGVLFVDTSRGKIFLFSDKLEEISLYGAYQYFYENGPIAIKDSIPNFVRDDNPANPRGVGYTASYDNKYKRFIITKRDYKFIGDDENASFSDASQYENKSYTISYYPTAKQWVSFHSYIPTNQFSIKQETILKDSMQTDVTSQAFHIINKGETMSKYFDNSVKPFIVDVVANKDAVHTKVYDGLFVNALTELPNNRKGSKLINTSNTFFDNVVFYNNTQCTGEYNLIIGDNVKSKEGHWYLQVPRDIVGFTDQQIFVDDWNFTQNSYPIDKVVNINKLDFNKPWYEQARMRDFYIGMRFTYNNLDNKKFLCNFVSTTYRTSYR